jgi:WD40 repeat protein
VWSADGSDEDHPLVLRGHEGVLTSAAFSPDGQHIVTASLDKTVRVWSADGSDEDHPLVLRGHEGVLTSAAFSPDGQHIVTASLDKTVRVWSVSLPLVQQGLRAAAECLSPELRRTYLGQSGAVARAGYEACERAAPPAPESP